jgi:small subunit ribosomal protein S16
MGRKKKPFYRVIVADSRTPRQGVSVDDLGYYDPMTEPVQIQINEEKALTWLKEGAIPTETARSLLSKAGILQKLHAEGQPGSEADEEEAPAEEQPDDESDSE